MAQTMLTLTDAAVSYFKDYLAEHADAIGVRFAVKHSGCSGYRYVTECAYEVLGTDKTVDIRGIRCLIDEKSLPMLAHMTLDYKVEGPGMAHLVYLNPNATNECGCGESFSLMSEQKQDNDDGRG